jgi:hypothetical protein
MDGSVVKLGVWLPVVVVLGYDADQLAALAALASGEDR